MRPDIVTGAVFPDYELTDHTGKHRKLSDLQGPDPMILVLSRGGFCPKDRRQAEGLVQLHHEMEVGYSRLVTISTDNMLATNDYPSAGAHWTFLSDPGRKGPRHRRVHGSRARSDDPARHRPRTRSRYIQDL
jgi:peroxiredoxin